MNIITIILIMMHGSLEFSMKCQARDSVVYSQQICPFINKFFLFSWLCTFLQIVQWKKQVPYYGKCALETLQYCNVCNTHNVIFFADSLNGRHRDHESVFPWRSSPRISGQIWSQTEKDMRISEIAHVCIFLSMIFMKSAKLIFDWSVAGGDATKLPEKENLGSKLFSIVI